ncbi:MAG TPA: glycerophosphodiester phosphodiesterase [Candidatus Saccharimonadales bacterium]|nr:glycerophosphodiester phosphodiesterase [Candidatus Saccharimonadales bacterium]
MQIISHRGAKGHALENSRDAFVYASQSTADYIEFDVRQTADNRLVVIHGRNTRHVTGRSLTVKENTLKSLTSVKTKNGQTIMTLDEVIDQIKGLKKINIEVKSPGAGTLVAPYIPKLLKSGLTYDDFFLSSFRVKVLREIRAENKEVHLALLHRIHPLTFLRVSSELNLWGVGFRFDLCWKWVVRSAKKRGLFTYAYFVNWPWQMPRMRRVGVDAVCTNYPDSMSKLR